MKLTKSDWLKIGEKSGWMKAAQTDAFVEFFCTTASVTVNVDIDDLEMDERCKAIAISTDPWNIKINKYLEIARDIAENKLHDITVRETLSSEGIGLDAVLPMASDGTYVRSIRVDWDELTKRLTGQEETL